MKHNGYWSYIQSGSGWGQMRAERIHPEKEKSSTVEPDTPLPDIKLVPSPHDIGGFLEQPLCCTSSLLDVSQSGWGKG